MANNNILLAQMALANILNPSKDEKGPAVEVKRRSKKSSGKKQKTQNRRGSDHEELPFSTELNEIIQNTLQMDEHGKLRDNVSSMLSANLNMSSVYFPTYSLMTSNTATMNHTRNLDKAALRNKRTLGECDFEEELQSISQETYSDDLIDPLELAGKSLSIASQPEIKRAKTPQLNDLQSRLKVLWLKRQSTFYYSDGMLTEAANSLQEAIQEHLGTDDYMKANLLEETMTSDANEIYDTVKKEFFDYDMLAHKKALVIQRAFMRKYRYLASKSTLISKLFRGYMARKRVRQLRRILNQCAAIIQKQYREHLKLLNKLATLIKRWYLMRKQVKQYQAKLKLFKAAKLIQRYFRGFQGRLKHRRQQLIIRSITMIQRRTRAFIIRNQRYFALSRIFRYYFFAARKIQRMVRSRQAIHRTRMKILNELVREDLRNNKERIILSELLKIEMFRKLLQKESNAGKLEYFFQLRKQQAKLDLMLENISHAEKEQRESFVTPQVIQIIDKFDELDENKIATARLRSLLRALNLQSSESVVRAVAGKLDPDETGAFFINDFLAWFNSAEVDELEIASNRVNLYETTDVEENDRVDRSITNIYKLLHKEQVTRYFLRHYQQLFRSKYAPKYQCCQCLEGFALFTDYFHHFHEKENTCIKTNRRALFFREYWQYPESKTSAESSEARRDNLWLRQREIEREILRVNDEFAHVKFHVRQRLFQELAMVKHDRALKEFFRAEEKVLAEYFYDDLSQDSDLNLKEKVINFVLEILSVTTVAGKVTTISDFLLHLLEECLLLRALKSQWIFEEFAGSLDELKLFLRNHLRIKVQKNDAMESSISNHAENITLKGMVLDNIKGNDMARNANHYSKSQRSNSVSSNKNSNQNTNTEKIKIPREYSSNPEHAQKLFVFLQAPTYTKAALCKRWARQLAAFAVRCFHLMQIEAETSIRELVNFRSQRPRRVQLLNDELLAALELHALSSLRYSKDFELHFENQRAVTQKLAAMKRTAQENLDKRVKTCLQRFCGCFSERQVVVDKEVHVLGAEAGLARSAEEIRASRELQLLAEKNRLRHLVQVRANAHLIDKLRSRLGKQTLLRLENYFQQLHKQATAPQRRDLKRRLRWIFSTYSVNSIDFAFLLAQLRHLRAINLTGVAGQSRQYFSLRAKDRKVLAQIEEQCLPRRMWRDVREEISFDDLLQHLEKLQVFVAPPAPADERSTDIKSIKKMSAEDARGFAKFQRQKYLQLEYFFSAQLDQMYSLCGSRADRNFKAGESPLREINERKIFWTEWSKLFPTVRSAGAGASEKSATIRKQKRERAKHRMRQGSNVRRRNLQATRASTRFSSRLRSHQEVEDETPQQEEERGEERDEPAANESESAATGEFSATSTYLQLHEHQRLDKTLEDVQIAQTLAQSAAEEVSRATRFFSRFFNVSVANKLHEETRFLDVLGEGLRGLEEIFQQMNLSIHDNCQTLTDKYKSPSEVVSAGDFAELRDFQVQLVLDLLCRSLDVSCAGRLDEYMLAQCLRGIFRLALEESSLLPRETPQRENLQAVVLSHEHYLVSESSLIDQIVDRLRAQNQFTDRVTNLKLGIFGEFAARIKSNRLSLSRRLLAENHRRIARRQIDQALLIFKLTLESRPVDLLAFDQIGNNLFALQEHYQRVLRAVLRSSEQSLIVRTQLLAEKQSHAFTRNCILGKILLVQSVNYLRVIEQRARNQELSDRAMLKNQQLHSQVLGASNFNNGIDAVQRAIESRLHYAFLLHCSHSSQRGAPADAGLVQVKDLMLSSELAHLLLYVQRAHGLLIEVRSKQQFEALMEIKEVLSKARERIGIFSMAFDDVKRLLVESKLLNITQVRHFQKTNNSSSNSSRGRGNRQRRRTKEEYEVVQGEDVQEEEEDFYCEEDDVQRQILEDGLQNVRQSEKVDAEVRWRSLARQQALMLAFSFNILRGDVQETHTRSLMLALQEMMKYEVRNEYNSAVKNIPVNKLQALRVDSLSYIPSDYSALYLLAKGFSVEEILSEPSIQRFIANKLSLLNTDTAERDFDGNIQELLYMVPVEELFSKAKASIWKRFGFFKKFHRGLIYYLGGYSRYKKELRDYLVVLKLLESSLDMINQLKKYQMTFLKEIITGVSK